MFEALCTSKGPRDEEFRLITSQSIDILKHTEKKEICKILAKRLNTTNVAQVFQ